jgi:hypothetical protein
VILFSGVEIPSNRTLLESMDVKHVMLSYWGLRKRGLPKTKPYLIAEHFDEDMLVWVDSGAIQADKAGLSIRELEEYLADYEDFIAYNYDRIEGWVEFDSQVLGIRRVQEERAAFEEDPKMWVVWHSQYGVTTLQQWSEQYFNVAIPYESIEQNLNIASVTRNLKAKFKVDFHALGTAKPDNLRQVPFTTASTLSWISPMRRGETIVWDGMKIVRYPKKMKDQARSRYKKVVEDAGLDFIKFRDDDTKEATKVAVWSYLQLEKKMKKDDDSKPELRVIKGDLPSIEDMLADNSDDTLYTGLMDFDPPASNNRDLEERKKVTPRDPIERTPMPVFGYESKTIVDVDDEGNEVLKQAPIVKSEMTSLRQCNTCFVAANCPAFKEDSTCAFNLPVEVKTKEQLKALLTAIIEMQGQRVAFMRFAEEMNGGYADPNVSQEVDRLFKLVKSMKELEENREYVRFTAERATSGGVLSAIFGDRAQVLREMEQPINEQETTQIIRQSIEDD